MTDRYATVPAQARDFQGQRAGIVTRVAAGCGGFSDRDRRDLPHLRRDRPRHIHHSSQLISLAEATSAGACRSSISSC